MMRRLAAGLAVVASVVVAASAASAAPSAVEVAGSDVAEYPNVSLTVTVPAEFAGHDLPSSAFTVIEAGNRRPVEAMRLPGDDLEVVLVIDTSGSMRGAAVEAAKAAALTFIDGLPPTTRLAVVTFGRAPGVVSPFSSDHGAARIAVQNVQVAGETALYDAVSLAAGLFTPGAGRRALVVLSDGADTASRLDLDDAVAALSAAQAHADMVELATPESTRAALDRLAVAGGGRVVSAADPGGLVAIYKDLAASLASQHRLAYRSESHGDTDVTVELRVGDAVASGVTRIPLPPRPAGGPVTSDAKRPSPRAVSGSSERLLWMGTAAFFLSFLILGLLAFLAQRRRRTTSLLAQARSRQPGANGLKRFGDAASVFIERTLERWGRRRSMNSVLEEAGVALRPGEFAVVALCGALAVSMLGVLTAGLVGAVGGFVVTLLGARAVLSVMASRRRSKFSDQLGDTLQLLASSLRAGYALLQAVDSVARDADSPTGDEFRRLVIETRLGRDLSESLRAMGERVGGEDFEWVVQAIEINREVGGDLAEVLDNVGDTIRERNQLRRQVKALTAEGRLSAYILLALPFVLALALKFINPGYFDGLTQGPGLALVGMAGIFMTVGGLWLKKLVKLAY